MAEAERPQEVVLLWGRDSFLDTQTVDGVFCSSALLLLPFDPVLLLRDGGGVGGALVEVQR